MPNSFPTPPAGFPPELIQQLDERLRTCGRQSQTTLDQHMKRLAGSPYGGLTRDEALRANYSADEVSRYFDRESRCNAAGTSLAISYRDGQTDIHLDPQTVLTLPFHATAGEARAAMMGYDAGTAHLADQVDAAIDRAEAASKAARSSPAAFL